MAEPMLSAHDIVYAKTGINYGPDVALWYGVTDDDRAIARAQVLADAGWLENQADRYPSSPPCQAALREAAAALRKAAEEPR